MHHVRSRLSPYSRLLLCQRIAAGRPVAHVAAEMGVSRQTAHQWIGRFATEGAAGLLDRSSRPLHSPTGTPARVEARSCEPAKPGMGRYGSRVSSGCPPRPSGGSCTGTGCRCCGIWTG